MEIVVEEEAGKFKIKEYVIRKKHHGDFEDEVLAHFEAVVADSRKDKDKPVHCFLRYLNGQGDFVGLDEQEYYWSRGLDEMFVQVAIDLPAETARVEVRIMEARPMCFVDRYEGWLVAGGFVVFMALVVLAAKGLFGWQ